LGVLERGAQGAVPMGPGDWRDRTRKHPFRREKFSNFFHRQKTQLSERWRQWQ
jgi:hypothetical protein